MLVRLISMSNVRVWGRSNEKEGKKERKKERIKRIKIYWDEMKCNANEMEISRSSSMEEGRPGRKKGRLEHIIRPIPLVRYRRMPFPSFERAELARGRGRGRSKQVRGGCKMEEGRGTRHIILTKRRGWAWLKRCERARILLSSRDAHSVYFLTWKFRILNMGYPSLVVNPVRKTRQNTLACHALVVTHSIRLGSTGNCNSAHSISSSTFCFTVFLRIQARVYLDTFAQVSAFFTFRLPLLLDTRMK